MPKPSKQKVEKFKKGEMNLAQVFDVNAEQMAALLMTGRTLYEQERLEDAKNIFEGLAILDGRNPYVQAMLGSIYQKEEKYEAAITRYSRALSLFPQDVNSLANRGEIYVKQGRLQEAATDLKRAIELDPQKKNPAANRARLLISVIQEALKLVKEGGVKAVLEAKKQIDQQLGSAS